MPAQFTGTKGASARRLEAPIDRATSWFVDAVVLTRPDYVTLEAALARRLQDHDDQSTVLDEACAALATALTASIVRWHEEDTPGRTPAVSGLVELHESRSAALRLPTSEPPHYVIEIGGLTGGRRLLSDDAAMLTALAVLTARRVDAIRLTRERYPDARVVLVLPPSREAQEERMRRRGDDEQRIGRRLAMSDEEEREGRALADHVIVNDDLDRAVEELTGIVSAWRNALPR